MCYSDNIIRDGNTVANLNVHMQHAHVLKAQQSGSFINVSRE